MLCFQAEGWNWGSHGQSSLLAGCHSDPEQFMISASVSLGVPEASPCLAHQGCHPGDGQKEGSSGQRAPGKPLSGILLLCHPSFSPPWMVTGVTLALTPSLAPLIQHSSQSTKHSDCGTGGEGITAGRKPVTPHPKGLEAESGRKEVGPQSVQPLLYGVGHFRPCFPKSHHSWL